MCWGLLKVGCGCGGCVFDEGVAMTRREIRTTTVDVRHVCQALKQENWFGYCLENGLC